MKKNVDKKKKKGKILYILIDDHLKICNLTFVLIKKKTMLKCHLIKMTINLRGSFKINWKNVGSNSIIRKYYINPKI